MASDGSTLYSVSQDTSLKIYSLSEKKQLRSVNICELALSSCQLTPDEKAIVAGSWDNNLYMYSIDYGRVKDTVAAHDDAVSCLCLRNDVVVTGSWDATVKVTYSLSSFGVNYHSHLFSKKTWGYSSSGLSKMPLTDFDFEAEVHCIDAAQQGNIAVSGAADGIFYLFSFFVCLSSYIRKYLYFGSKEQICRENDATSFRCCDLHTVHSRWQQNSHLLQWQTP